MDLLVRIHRPMYEFNSKRYMDIIVPEESIPHILEKHRPHTTLSNPLKENILRVKVPYRYKRIDCKVEGIVPVQDMKKDDQVEVSIVFCGAWDTGLYWKFSKLRHINKNIY